MRTATAVILTRGSGEALELFLAKRAPELRFFGGYQAFLGGVVDGEDRDAAEGEEQELLRCAWRELFEEVGVLPPALAKLLDARQRASLRAGLLSRDEEATNAAIEFRALLDRCPELCTPGSSAAPRSIGWLTTPPFAPVRYRTLFVRIELPAGEQPEVVPGELVEGAFVRPAAMLERWRRGEALVAPPVVYFLSELAAHPEQQAWQRLADGCAACTAGKLHQIRTVPGIWMAPLATETIPPATTTNAYWIGSERSYLVDPASFDPREQARLFDFIEERLSAGLQLAGVIATHHHHDHIGAIVPVAQRYSVPILGHPRTLERIELGGCEVRELQDGDELDLGARPDRAGPPSADEAPWSLRAYHTPGHDQGHLVLVESAYHAALVGDLCSTVSTIVIDPPEGHMATYLASLERMLSVPMGLLHPAHGPVHPDGHKLLRIYLEHRRQREQRILDALGAEPRSIESLVQGVYDDVLPAIVPLAKRSLLAGLQKLEEEGRAASSPGGWSAAQA